MTEPILATHGLTKHFGALKATDGVSLDLRCGENHAVIGPNGAGKTTLFRMLTGEESPDSGEIRVGPFEFTGFAAWPLEDEGGDIIDRLDLKDDNLAGIMK